MRAPHSAKPFQLRPPVLQGLSLDRNLIRSLICPSSVACVSGCCPVSPAFDSLWWAPFLLAAFCDHSTLQQRGDDIALIFIEQASDIGHVEPVVEKEVANRNASLGLGIEIHAVSRHVKFSLTHLEAISSFMAGLLHLDTLEKRPKFLWQSQRERVAFLSTAVSGISFVRKISQAVLSGRGD